LPDKVLHYNFFLNFK